MRFARLALLFSLSLCTQAQSAAPQAPPDVRVTISLQPKQVFIAAEGSVLTKVAMYSAAVCNYSPATITRSEGMLRQIAETKAGLNVIDSALVPATAARAAKRSKLGKFLTGLKWGGVVAAVVLAGKVPTKPVWSEGAGALAGAIELAQTALVPEQAAATQEAASAQTAAIDPAKLFALAPGACMTRIIFGEYVAGFKPVSN